MVFIIAGPCAIESEEQVILTAEFMKTRVEYFRGGAYKPRTNPEDFQGMGAEGIRLLEEIKDTGLKVVTELMDARDIPLFKNVDVIQIGARNMQNFSLLKEVADTKKTVLFKRHFGATIKEWVAAAQYLKGCEVWMCARGIRTFETETRNTADIDAIPILKQMGFTVVFDPSHSAGRRDLIIPLSKAAIAAGCDGLMVEVHPEPDKALCDAKQQLDLKMFDELLEAIKH